MAHGSEQHSAVIVGAGAVGLALGGCLRQSGWDTAYVVRDATGDARHAVEAHGIVRTGFFGEARVAPGEVAVHRSFQQAAAAGAEYLLVCTKSTSTGAVADALGKAWHGFEREPVVVLCQNGWGNAERFAARVPRDRIFNARIITGFRRTAAHAVEVTVHADAIRLGGLFGQEPHVLAALGEGIAGGGIPCELSDDIAADLWAKVLYNCLLNPLGALVGVPYGALAERAQTRSTMEAIAREIFEVLEHTGHETHWRTADAYLETFYRQLLPPTALHESSMLQDLRAGRPTEIDALCGAVARLGAAHDVATPVNEALTALIHLAEQRRPDGALDGPVSGP